MKTSNCLVCGIQFYKYRKCLKFCSWKCSSETRKIKVNHEYKNKIKLKIKDNSFVDDKTNCWIWKKNKDKEGRGIFWYNRKKIAAYRASYIVFKEEIYFSLIVCHKCDNPSCVNPDHLYLGTHKENIDDRERKKRGAKGEKIGISKLKNENIFEIKALRKLGLTQQKIAEKFNVCQTSISRILQNKSWKHI